MTTKQLAIIDAACEVAAFSKTNSYPQEGTPIFFDFAQKLDALATAINAEYPSFNRNVRTASLLQYSEPDLDGSNYRLEYFSRPGHKAMQARSIRAAIDAALTPTKEPAP